MTEQQHREQICSQVEVNWVVEAGAGTGKTRLLIDRLCTALLVQGIEPTHLVALTFTEKAAAEIKTRLLLKLQLILRALRDDTAAVSDSETKQTLDFFFSHFTVSKQQLITRAELALEQLDHSPIGTIHSFCADILRMYPLEAGLTPRAEIDTGTLAQRIFDTQWNHFLDVELGENAPRAAVWKEVLQKISLDDLCSCAREMCHLRIRPNLSAEHRKLLITVCRERAEKAQFLSTAFLAGKKKPRIIEQALTQAAQRFTQAAHWLQTGILPQQEQETLAIKSIPKDWEADSVEEAKELCRFAVQADPFVQQLIQKVYGLLDGFVEQVTARYQTEGVLSFDDLLVHTRDLLQHNLFVRRLLQERYDALYIDEFQDTDPVQGELLLFLAEQKGTGAQKWQEVKLQPGKLFVVGDPKQSIYRFRGADITAYEAFTDLILKQGGQRGYLRQNYRSEREIISLANAVCSAVMMQKAAFQPAYEPIFTAKKELFRAAEMALVYTPEEQKIDADDFRHNQAQFIAQWITENVGKMTLLNGDKLAYKDIAILSRAATTLSPYIEALRRAGIPFSLEDDRDFYRRQEVSDLLNILRVLDNPQDRIALAGVLRSPWGGLTDEELYQVFQRGEDDFRCPCSNAKAASVFQQLRSFYAATGREPLPLLLRRILQETLLPEACAVAYDAEQSIANLQRLVALAEGYTLHTPATLGQFLSRLADLSSQAYSQANSFLETDTTQAVSVMTVHKSKGLEFPVVFLVDISKQEAATAVTRPLHLYAWGQEMYGFRVGKYGDICYAWLEEEQREHSRCEEVRILYVALTRAREKLWVVGNANSDRRTLAACFARGGRFPLTGQRPPVLGTEEKLYLTYIPYKPPEQFIYTQQFKETLPPAWNLTAWRQAQDRRQLEYKTLCQQQAPLAPSLLADGADNPAALQLGTLVHQALAAVMQGKDDHLQAADAPAQLISQAKQLVQQIVACDMYVRLREMKLLGTEMPFSLDTPQGIVSGVIDLLLQDKDDTVWVIDYKTDQVVPGQEQLAAQKYTGQLSVYVQVVHKIYPFSPIQSAVVFVRNAVMVCLK